MTERKTELLTLRVADLVPARDNPRQAINYESEQFVSLAKSIKAIGVIVPLGVVPLVTNKKVKSYEIRFGHRRWEAAKLAEIDTVPAVVHYGLSQAEAYELTVKENFGREDLTPLEECRTTTRMLELFCDPELVADKLGRTANWVKVRARITKHLVYRFMDALEAGEFDWSAAHLEQVARLNSNLQCQLLDQIKKNTNMKNFSVSELRKHLNDYYHRLEDAIWDLADKDIEEVEWIACSECTNRTICNKFLFADLAEDDYCTDPDCWHKKKKYYMQKKVDKAIKDGCLILDIDKSEYRFNIPSEKLIGYINYDYGLNKPAYKTGYEIRKVFIVSHWLLNFGDIVYDQIKSDELVAEEKIKADKQKMLQGEKLKKEDEFIEKHIKQLQALTLDDLKSIAIKASPIQILFDMYLFIWAGGRLINVYERPKTDKEWDEVMTQVFTEIKEELPNNYDSCKRLAEWTGTI